jgi:hypothetical protein
MLKVLSTKLKVEEINRFAEIAEQQGETKSGLSRRLVLEYLDNYSEADRVTSTGTSSPANYSEKGLLIHSEGLHSGYLPPVHHQPQTKTQKCTSAVNSGLPIPEDVNRPLNPDLLPTSRQPVYHNAEPGRPATSPKQSSGIGLLILLCLLTCGLRSTSVDTVDHAPRRLAQGIGLGVYR